MRRIWLAAALAAALIGCGGDDDGATPDGGPPPDAGFPDAGACEGPNGPCTVLSPGANAQEEIQEALIEAQPGDIILFEAGRFELTAGLSLDVEGVTLRGRGMDRSILSWTGQIAGAQGLLVTAGDFVIEDLGLEDTVGDIIKIV
jgi:hypothetical protein